MFRRQTTIAEDRVTQARIFVAGAHEGQMRRKTFWATVRQIHGLTPTALRGLRRETYTCRRWTSRDGITAALLHQLPTGRWEVQYYTDGNPDGTIETSDFYDAFFYARGVSL